MAALSVQTVLGEFRRPNEGAEFQGRLGDVAVVLDADEEFPAAELAERVSMTVGELAGFARRIAVELADSFSPERPGEVEVWENGETVISAAEFARRLRLDCITAAGEDDIELYFDDDGMFGGHSIRVWVDDVGSMTDAQIAG
ncbi:DUF2262 domain-containing protein [Actinoplanes sp. CA-142083]|uniref:DUF2262 domain-containing protein n=1 Tax=Actinoplanes sp. CA-142083 TaxID=3239903 RepID=UPI003D945B26